MPLPLANTAWPPVHMAGPYAKMREWAAWYSGEPTRIMDVYASRQGSQVSAPVPWWRFWSRARAGIDGAQRALLHVPVASDLAGVSGALLFGEPPVIRVRATREMDALIAEQAVAVEAENAQKLADHEAAVKAMGVAPQLHPTGGGAAPESLGPALPKLKPIPTAPLAAPEDKAEARFLEIAEKGDFFARLVEAAETAAAIGGVYIYPVWDEDLRDVPLLGIAQSDMAIPEFKWGFLTAVTFHRVIETEGHRVLRHVERHEVEGAGEGRRAVVLNGLYQGTEFNLGIPVGLASHLATATLGARVELPFPELDVEYIPNIRPNRLWRASGLGVADIQGSETLLDALDETYASWMRDVRLAKARIIVPNEYLRPDADGNQAFDIDQEIYVGMDMEPVVSQDARSMMAHQFQIRHAEHRATAHDLVERIVSNAGYTPATLGTGESNLRSSASALRVSEHKTLLTLRRKATWWNVALSNVLYHMAKIDAEVFQSGVEPVRPTVLMTDSIIDNPLELAQTVLAMKTAESASIETRVRILHPDWSSDEVKAEVVKIKDEAEVAKPAPAVGTLSGGTFGPLDGDPAATSKFPVTAKEGSANGAPPPPMNPGAKLPA